MVGNLNIVEQIIDRLLNRNRELELDLFLEITVMRMDIKVSL